MISARQEKRRELMDKTFPKTQEEMLKRNKEAQDLELEIWELMDQLELYETAEREEGGML